MKKMLTLMVILSIASLASAALSPMTIGHNTGNTLFTIDLLSGMAGNTTSDPPTGDNSGSYWALIGVNASSGALAATLPAVMSLSAITGDAFQSGLFAEGLGVVGEFRTSTMGSWSGAAGTWADSFTLREGVTTLYLYRIDDAVEVATLIDTYVIPEPVTMALLSLGGLFLRRRK
jgi:hypothetical protein